MELKILRTARRELMCKLTDDEQREAGNQLAALCEEIAAEEIRQTDIKTQLKAKLTELQSRLAQLAIKVRRREELRPVDVDIQLLSDHETVREVRKDTGEVMHVRKIEADEQQPGLFE